MTMESDVRSTRRTSSGTISAGPARLKAVAILAGAAVGTIQFRDGGASGTILCEIDSPASVTATVQVLLPANGVRFTTDIYATLTGGAIAVTAFYA